MPQRKSAPRQRGEPQTRQRVSRRMLRVRSRREAYCREVGLDPARDAIVHVELVKSWTRHLESVRQHWANWFASESALATLRIVLPAAISGRECQQSSDMLDQLAQWLEKSRAPSWMRTPEDRWMVDAQHELDDDEIAKVLSPAGYRRDRQAALRAVRERRRKIARRR